VGFFLVPAEQLLDIFEPDEGEHHQGDDPPPGQFGEAPDFEEAQGHQGDNQQDQGHRDFSRTGASYKDFDALWQNNDVWRKRLGIKT
jgi:hypothetical protein